MDLLPILPLMVFVYLLPTTLNMYQSIFSMPCVLSSYPGHLWVQFKKCHFSCNSSYRKQDTHTKILKDHPKSCPKIQNIFIHLTCENALLGICFSVKTNKYIQGTQRDLLRNKTWDKHKKKAFGVDCETNTKVFLRSIMRRRRKHWLNNKVLHVRFFFWMHWASRISMSLASSGRGTHRALHAWPFFTYTVREKYTKK